VQCSSPSKNTVSHPVIRFDSVGDEAPTKKWSGAAEDAGAAWPEREQPPSLPRLHGFRSPPGTRLDPVDRKQASPTSPSQQLHAQGASHELQMRWLLS